MPIDRRCRRRAARAARPSPDARLDPGASHSPAASYGNPRCALAGVARILPAPRPRGLRGANRGAVARAHHVHADVPAPRRPGAHPVEMAKACTGATCVSAIGGSVAVTAEVTWSSNPSELSSSRHSSIVVSKNEQAPPGAGSHPRDEVLVLERLPGRDVSEIDDQVGGRQAVGPRPQHAVGEHPGTQAETRPDPRLARRRLDGADSVPLHEPCEFELGACEAANPRREWGSRQEVLPEGGDGVDLDGHGPDPFSTRRWRTANRRAVHSSAAAATNARFGRQHFNGWSLTIAGGSRFRPSSSLPARRRWPQPRARGPRLDQRFLHGLG